LLHSFLTVPDLCQGKEPLILLNRRLNVPQCQSGCYGKEINTFLLPGFKPQFLSFPACNVVATLSRPSRLPRVKVCVQKFVFD